MRILMLVLLVMMTYGGSVFATDVEFLSNDEVVQRLQTKNVVGLTHDQVKSSCDSLGLYSFVLVGCPAQAEFPNANLNIPICEQPEMAHFSYLDSRCFTEVPFDWSKPCFEWECPVPYVHTFFEPITETTKVVQGGVTEIDQHYRAARQSLGYAYQHIAYLEAKILQLSKGKK